VRDACTPASCESFLSLGEKAPLRAGGGTHAALQIELGWGE